MQPVVIVHGGAGPARPDRPAHAAAERLVALEDAVERAFAQLGTGAGALAACVAAVAALEDCPLFNAGTGSALASDGRVWCDAAVMTGEGHSAAVAAVTGVRNPVHGALALLEDGDTLLWAGNADELVARYGLRPAGPQEMVTSAARARLDRHLAGVRRPGSGTVGAVCLDASGRLAAATSTGGRIGKHPARVGDSPLVGAGTWCTRGCCWPARRSRAPRRTRWKRCAPPAGWAARSACRPAARSRCPAR